MGVIKPTLTVTANSSTASKEAGPLSMALSLSATDSLSVKAVTSKIVSPTVADDQGLWDDASLTAGTETSGTDGGFVYVKNLHASYNILIGHAAAQALEGAGEADRLMTLKPGEFAWFPWDFTADLIMDAVGGTATNGLESWVFTRTQ